MERIETYELTHLYKQLTELSKRDLTGSGVHIALTALDGSAIGEMQFIGELLPKLIPILQESLQGSLAMRLSQAKSDIAKIELALKKEQ